MPILRRGVNVAVAHKAGIKSILTGSQRKVALGKTRLARANRAVAFNPSSKALQRARTVIGSDLLAEKINEHLTNPSYINASSNLRHEVRARKSSTVGSVRKLVAVASRPLMSKKNKLRLKNVKGSKLLGANRK